MTAFIGWLAVLIFLSGLFSCSETSLFSLSKSDISYLNQHSPASGRRAESLLAFPRKTLITILIGNMFVNILSSSTCESYIHTSFPGGSILVSLAVMTPLILLFGEVAPKIIAFQLRRKTVPVLSLLVRFLYYVLYPLQYIVFKLTDPFIRLIFSVFPRKSSPQGSYSEEEIKAAVDIGSARGIFDQHEKTLITNLLKFRPTTAKYVLTPRTDIYSIDIDAPVADIKERITESPYSRIPVYRESADNIIGVFLLKDIFSDKNIFADKITFVRHLKEPYFVPETIKAHLLFSLMVRRQMHIHFAVDEYGGLEGLVTLDDVLSEIFGSIKEEHERELLFWPAKEEPGSFIVKAGLPIEEYNHLLKPEIEDEDAVTVGGFISNRLGCVPDPGDSLEYREYIFTVLAASDRRSLLIKITPPGRSGGRDGSA